MLDFLLTYLHYWPLAAFIALILAGLNIPVSEDAIIVASAAICYENPKLLIPTVLFVYAGIIASDIISYFWGYFCSKGLRSLKAVNRILKSNKRILILNRLEKHGFLTFITIRFIPFGVRNALFLSSGFFHLKFWKFIIFDAIAAVISSQSLFWIVYFLGDNSDLWVRIIAGVLLVFLICFVIWNIRSIKKELNQINSKTNSDPQSQNLQNIELR